VTRSNFRIPRVAAAALVLGGGACGGSKAGAPPEETHGINTSAARIRAISRAGCEAEQRCEPADFSDSYTSLNECVEWRVDAFPLSGQSGEEVRKCQDAVLDLAICESKAECESEGECWEFYETYVELCKRFDADDDDELSSARHVLRAFRIPRWGAVPASHFRPLAG
jgi:hypothetical protein